MKRHIGLKEAFGVRGGTVVGDFDEDCGSKADILTGWDDKSRLLDEFRVFPLGVADDGLVEPLVGDWGTIRVAGRHERELEERCCSSVKHLNVYRVDLLQLLDQRSVVVRIQHMRESEDEVTPKREGDVGRFEDGECPP